MFSCVNIFNILVKTISFCLECCIDNEQSYWYTLCILSHIKSLTFK